MTEYKELKKLIQSANETIISKDNSVLTYSHWKNIILAEVCNCFSGLKMLIEMTFMELLCYHENADHVSAVPCFQYLVCEPWIQQIEMVLIQ